MLHSHPALPMLKPALCGECLFGPLSFWCLQAHMTVCARMAGTKQSKCCCHSLWNPPPPGYGRLRCSAFRGWKGFAMSKMQPCSALGGSPGAHGYCIGDHCIRTLGSTVKGKGLDWNRYDWCWEEEKVRSKTQREGRQEQSYWVLEELAHVCSLLSLSQLIKKMLASCIFFLNIRLCIKNNF